MLFQKGLGKGIAVPLIAASAIASGANAAFVTYSTVVTNNTASEKVYDLSKSFKLAENLGNTGGTGSLAIVLTDIRGGGAYLKGVEATSIFTGFVNNSQVVTLTPPSSITATQFGQNSFSTKFAAMNYGVTGSIDQFIKSQLKFILSAGDQAVISSTFEVVSFTPVPTPGAISLIVMAGGISARGRRRGAE